ncbi:MAG: PHP domain-containing protein [Clostridia bacterium]|nr:PHP domain-containing protein [Clostridia bacterium]
MRVTADYHTHSRYSKWYHAKHTIDQMAQRAKELGLEEIAITDHGPKHLFYGIKPSQLARAKQDTRAASKKHGIKVFMGVEANLLGADGQIDLTDDQIKDLDILLVGFHKGTKPNFINYFDKKQRNSQEQIEKNTQAYINAINRYPIDIITHLNEYIRVDTKRVAEACAKRGTILEFNSKHMKFTDEDIEILKESGVNFVVSSDAHNKKRIRDVDSCLELIKSHNIPLDRVKNINQTLKFLPKV